MNLEKINNQYSFLFNIPEGYIPSKFNEGLMSKTFFGQEDAFVINPIVNGVLTSPIEGSLEFDYSKTGLLLRMKIGYAMMARIEDNFTLGCLSLSQIINAMLYEAYKYKTSPLSSFKTLTFQRPGKTNEFFKELEDSLGYELRLFIEPNVIKEGI